MVFVPFAPRAGVKTEIIPRGMSMATLWAVVEFRAMNNPITPYPSDLGDPRFARLFPDYPAVERKYFQQTGIFPIMHVTVIKQEIVDKYPWAAVSLVKAFDKAKAIAYKRVANPRITPLAWVRTAFEEERKILGPDPWVYGLGESNRKNLETIIRYCHQQGLIGRPMSVDELFIDTDPEDGGDVDHV
jgi:4,5-dihydroxyphthalate decarboxylase